MEEIKMTFLRVDNGRHKSALRFFHKDQKERPRLKMAAVSGIPKLHGLLECLYLRILK